MTKTSVFRISKLAQTSLFELSRSRGMSHQVLEVESNLLHPFFRYAVKSCRKEFKQNAWRTASIKSEKSVRLLDFAFTLRFASMTRSHD